MAQKIVQQLDKLTNNSLILGLNNGSLIEANGSSSTPSSNGIKVYNVVISKSDSNFASNELVTQNYVSNQLSSKLNISDLYGKITASGDDIITLTKEGTEATGVMTFKAAHKTFETLSGTAGTAVSSGSSVITGLTRDNYGHITGYTTGTITFSNYQGWTAKGDTGNGTIASGNTVNIVGDSSKISSVLTAASNEFTFTLSHAQASVTDNTGSPESVSITAGSTGSIPVNNYTFDSTGHISSISQTKYTIDIPTVTIDGTTETYGSYVTHLTSNNHVITRHVRAGLTDISGITSSSTEEQKYTLVTAIAAKTYIDAKLASTESMVYKGLLANASDATSALATSGASVGWTYKASASFTLLASDSSTGNPVNVYTGDMLIINKDGGGNLKFDVSPSGADDKVSTDGTLTTGKIIIGAGNKSVAVSSITVEDAIADSKTIVSAGNQISVTGGKATETAGDQVKDNYYFTISHGAVGSAVSGKDFGNSDTTITSLDGILIPRFQLDSNGHVVTYTTNNTTANLQSAVDSRISAKATYTSTDFEISGLGGTINISGTAASNKLSKNGAVLNWGGTDITIGDSSVKSVAVKLGTGYENEILTADATGNPQSSGKEILTSGQTWSAGSDDKIPTTAAIDAKIASELAANVPAGVSQVVSIPIVESSTVSSSTYSIPSGSLIKKITVVITSGFEAGSGTISVGGTTLATEGKEYLINESNSTFIIEPYAKTTTASVASINKTSTSTGTGSGTVYIEFIASPLE